MNHLLRYLTNDVKARFEAKFVRGGPDECWIWTAAKDRYGYGRMWIPRQNRGALAGAHRIAWALANQAEIPEGLLVLHRCDSPPCVNPNHLFLGTQADNMADKVAKNRQSRIARKGESHGSAKLMETQVVAIFYDPRPHAQIAGDFGVSRGQVWGIKAGRTWRHLGLKGIANDRNGNAKLTEDQVIAIFFDPRPRTEIAADFGITRRNVQLIKAGMTWRQLGLNGI